MAISVQSCPHLCARQGVAHRHEVGPVAVAMRMLAVLRVVIAGLIGTAWRRQVDRFTGTSMARRYVPKVYRRVIAASGITVEVTGLRETFANPGEPVLVVGNHVSWLDVMGLACVQPVRMVSKREIGEWPVIGTVATAAGTIFIDRFAPRRVAATHREVASALRAGEVIATFPEATTTCGRGIGRMYPAMFQAAIDAGVPVQPVALTFVDSHGCITTAGAYVGEQPLMDSIRSILGQRDLRLRIEVLPRISPKHVRPIDDRKALRTAAHSAISEALELAVGDYDAHLRPATCQARPLAIPVVADPLTELEAIAAKARRTAA
ncbi:1-acyl-sn-glycerol-3-phosphate acyltransferase [Epidermidibacterium keratini]|uniref:1-acyl-sn-glycerol-3-phosphate acyltransferase n=1 Tax=Epidermidibacterium keratini TaxID=1891644 RepID=A0A7L4YLL3_9ACTN|nr:lysophospholipid acyltransferase family protein [Epidermidibacterium keratini]QHC00086.1 1-acyl-sn-glycerol-3-phosphate acyltransferase [Epidermidibacterium keratini]